MADSNNPRTHRGYDPQQRAGGADDAQRGGGGDPLAELARLIGQNDPFADFERNRASGEPQRAVRAAAPPQDQDWAPQPPQPPPVHAPHPDAYAAPAATDRYAPQDAAGQPQPEQYPAQAYAQHSDQAYGQPADPGREPYYDPYYDPDSPNLDEAEYHEQQDRKRRHRRLAAVLAILVLAVLGGAGAYGYRAYFGPVVRAAPPPVIKADTTPTKVMPAAQTGDSASNKLIYDRVGETNQAERVVPREEKPVDIKTATVTPAPRAVYPGPDANAVAASPSATIPVTGQRSTGQVLPVASEPSMATQGTGANLPSAKKVRTVTIRPDMTVVQSSVSAAPSDPAPPSRATPPARSAAPNLAAPPSSAPARTAPPPPRQTAAPLSLSPGGASASAPAPRAPARTAPPATAQRPLALATTAPAAAASEPRATTGGSVMVQVSSQRSEADAQASFRALQARYPNVFGGRSAVVRRADLGSRGVYYRSMVGPFATGDQAVQFCTSLKAAGGQCIIHRN